jgi:hypothetical protein
VQLEILNGTFNSKIARFCTPDENLLAMEWIITELRIFYGYILAGILFIVLHIIMKVEKHWKSGDGHDSITKKENGTMDFLESY